MIASRSAQARLYLRSRGRRALSPHLEVRLSGHAVLVLFLPLTCLAAAEPNVSHRSQPCPTNPRTKSVSDEWNERYERRERRKFREQRKTRGTNTCSRNSFALVAEQRELLAFPGARCRVRYVSLRDLSHVEGDYYKVLAQKYLLQSI